MKKTFLALTLLISVTAQADYGLIECGSEGGRHIKLNMDEVSDVTEESVYLTVDGRERPVSEVIVTKTKYGILKMLIRSGKGRAATRYTFENLGSAECFGVSGSGHKGKATVDVSNSLAHFPKLQCSCDQN